MDKSHVTLEQHTCAVCCATYDTGTLLMDTRLRKTFYMHTNTGWGLCPTCQKLHQDGFVALVACDYDKSIKDPDGTIGLAGAHRTGRVAHLRREVAHKVINAPLVGINGQPHPVIWCDDAVIDKLRLMTGPAVGGVQ